MHNKCEVNDDEMIQAELRVSSAFYISFSGLDKHFT